QSPPRSLPATFNPHPAVRSMPHVRLHRESAPSLPYRCRTTCNRDDADSNRSRHYRGRIRPRRFFFPLPHPHPSSSSARHHSAASRGGILPGRAACAGSAEEATRERARFGEQICSKAACTYMNPNLPSRRTSPLRSAERPEDDVPMPPDDPARGPPIEEPKKKEPPKRAE